MISVIAWIFGLVIKPAPPIRKNKQNVPLPDVCHMELDADDIRKKAVFVIGDVHGCYDELCALIQNARASASPDREVLFLFVGDLINKGPKNIEVLRLLQQQKSSMLSVRGNHEECVLREALRLRKDNSYELPGRYRFVKELSDADVQYLIQLPYTISVPSLNILVVHAGILPGKTLEEQELVDFTNMRNITVERNAFGSFDLIGTNKTVIGFPWSSIWTGPEHVYFGHDVKETVHHAKFATGIDTGCVHGGHLTGVFVNDRRVMIAVKAQSIYKTRSARN